MNIDTETIGSSVESSLETLTSGGWEGALKILITALLLFVLCFVLRRIFLRVLDRGLDRSRIDKSFHAFLRSAVNILLWFITATIVAQSLGINATSLLALLGIVGLAISLSVQGTLSNLAGGLNILAARPFKVGDYVDIGSSSGTIQEIGVVHTKLLTLDNRRVVVPNSMVVESVVTNHYAEELRRVDLVISASYDAPVDQVKGILWFVAAEQEKVLRDPPPFIRLLQYGDSSMDYTFRLWCRSEDYWEVYHGALEAVKGAFDQAGISIPYPQMDVHLGNEAGRGL